MLEALPFPLLLLIVAGALTVWHLYSWREARTEQHDAEHASYLARQFRRRVQVAAMMGLLAVAMYVGQVIPRLEYPSLFVFIWCGVVVLLVWMLLLALADLLDSRYRLARLRDDRRVAQAQLQLELDKARERLAAQEPPERRNGQAR